MKIRAVIAVVASFVVDTILLAVSYPIWRELRYQRHPTQHWIEVYLGMGILVTGVVWLVAFAVHWIMRQYSKREIVTAYIPSLVLTLLIFAFVVGTSHPYPVASWP